MSYDVQTDVYEIDIRTTAADEILKTASAVAKEEAGLERLTAAMAAHSAAAGKAAASQHELSVAASEMGSTFGFVTSQLGAVAGGLATSGYKLQQFGGLIDDLQYVGEQGLRPITNNLMAIHPALGILAVAAEQLYKHWDDLMGLMGQGFPQPAKTGLEGLQGELKKAQKEMEELGKKSRLTWFEVDRVAELKGKIEGLAAAIAGKEAVDDALAAPSEAEKDAGAGFGKALAESGGKVAFDEVKDALGAGADAKGLVFNEITRGFTTPEQAAQDLFAAALKGDTIARDAIAKALDGKSEFRANIAKFTPESPRDEADRKAEEQAEKFAREAENRKVQFQEENRSKEESEDAKAEEQAEKFAREAESRRAKWEANGGDEKAIIRDEKRAEGEARAARRNDREIDELMMDAMKGPERRTSSVVGAAGLADSVQAGVMGRDDIQKEQRDYLKKLVELNERIAERNANAGRALRFGGDGVLMAGG